MIEIDDERLEQLIEACKKEYPEQDNYVLWVVCMNYLLNEQGIYGDEAEAEKLREKRKEGIKYSVRIE